MQHPFEALEPEYVRLLATMKPTRPQQIDAVARKLLSFVAAGRYAQVSVETGVPQVWMATSFEREASSNFSLNPAQGDRWDRTSIHVPKGQPPFPSWAAAAKAAYHIDGLDKVGAGNWTMPLAVYYDEAFNGFGPRAHGRHSGYPWAGTNIYDGGKYVADGVWDPNAQDQQLGTVPVMVRMIQLNPSLALPGTPTPDAVVSIAPIPAPAPVPLGHGGGDRNALWIQQALNKAGCDPHITEDNSYGRETRRAVIAFQTSRGLEADGIAGPQTLAALEQVVGGG